MFETRCIIYISKKRLGKYGTDGIELSINDIVNVLKYISIEIYKYIHIYPCNLLHHKNC